MKGMEPHESVAVILGAISTYWFLITPVGKEMWLEMGIMRGWAPIGILCLATVAWLAIIDVSRTIISKIRGSASKVNK